MFTVVLDACVLVPITLCDTLLRIAATQAYGVRWSETILEETRRAIVRRGVPQTAAENRITQMRRAFPFAEVTGYEALIPQLTNDPKDRHVLAAAITAPVHTIVTANLKDFPTESLSAWEIEAVHPDDFLLSQLDLAPDSVMSAMRALQEGYRDPPRTVDQTLESLVRCGVPRFSTELRMHFGVS